MRTQHGCGPIYTTILLVKMLCVIVNKLSTLDPFGIGVEMEADKPNWYDALNGLPALCGSSVCETFELKRWMVFLREALGGTKVSEQLAVLLPEELHEFLMSVRASFELPDAAYWHQTAAAKERYRQRVRLGFAGGELALSLPEIREFLSQALAKVERGIATSYDAKLRLPRSYFAYEITAYDTVEGSPSTIKPTKWRQHALPLFLPGVVHALRVEPNVQRARALYQAVRRSDLYDEKLHMYRICSSLEGEPETIGRCQVFSPGWLENQSIWLHMEYKYLLELLRRGLHEEFFNDLSHVLIPFQPPDRYGRSILENCSFLVSSAYADPSWHGAGFVARLSGATAEFLQMWLWMTVGREPFALNERGELCVRLAPILSKEFFASDGRFECLFLGKTKIVYHNSQRLPTFGARRAVIRMIRLVPTSGDPIECHHGLIPPPYAAMIRDGMVDRLEVELVPQRTASREASDTSQARANHH